MTCDLKHKVASLKSVNNIYYYYSCKSLQWNVISTFSDLRWKYIHNISRRIDTSRIPACHRRIEMRRQTMAFNQRDQLLHDKDLHVTASVIRPHHSIYSTSSFLLRYSYTVVCCFTLQSTMFTRRWRYQVTVLLLINSSGSKLNTISAMKWR